MLHFPARASREVLPRTVCCAVLAVVFSLFASTSVLADTRPIRVGATLSLTGRYQEPSEMIQHAYRLWEEQVNRRGGLLGRPVELIVYDDQSRPERTEELYRKLLSEERVDMVLSPYGSPLTMVASEVTEEQGYVMLACASASEKVWGRGFNYLFGMYATAERYFVGLLDLMAREGLSSYTVMHETSLFHKEIAAGIEKWAKRFRLQGVARWTISDDPATQQAAVRGLTELPSPADALIVSAYPTVGHSLLETLRGQGHRPRILAMTIAPIHPAFHDRYGDFAQGVFAPSQWEPDERIPFPGTRDFVRAFQTASGSMPSYHAGSAYAACQVLERAVVQTASLDQHKIREFIASLDTVTVIGRFKVDGRGMQIGHNPILIQWQEGRKQIVYPSKMQTALPQF